jgi:hypothetical protein
MPALRLQRGDHVRLISEDTDAVVVDVKSRTIVVRIAEPAGTSHERHVTLDDVERLPTTKEAQLEAPRAHPLPIMTFAIGRPAWLAVDDAHVREDRVSAWLTALSSMYAELGSDGIALSVELLGGHGRRVLTLSTIEGHETFHKMQSAWDAHKMRMARHDIPEKRSLDIMRVADAAGTARIDAEAAVAYVFVRVTSSSPAEVRPFTMSARALLAKVGAADDLQGGAVFTSDEEDRVVLFTRWSGSDPAKAFANDVRSHNVLSPIEHLGGEVDVFARTGSPPSA